MSSPASPAATRRPGWLHSEMLGQAVVALVSAEALLLELWMFYLRLGEVVRAVLTVGLLWALWRGRVWARVVLGLLTVLGGGILLSSGSPSSSSRLLGLLTVALGLALWLVPGVGAFQAARRGRGHAGQ